MESPRGTQSTGWTWLEDAPLGGRDKTQAALEHRPLPHPDAELLCFPETLLLIFRFLGDLFLTKEVKVRLIPEITLFRSQDV